METALLLLLGALTAHYALVLLRFARGFAQVTAGPTPRTDATPFVSVIVPARNEGDDIAACLDALLGNTYPTHLFEILVVDDHSADDTAHIVRRYMTVHNRTDQQRLHLLSLQDAGPVQAAFKKSAIEWAVRQARGDVILTTDADCTVGPGWIETLLGYFTPGTDFVSGPVCYHIRNRLTDPMQALEFMGLIAVGAGAIGVGRPNMCNGANVAYRKQTFLDLGGFSGIDHVASGDDELLMQKIHAAHPGAVRFCADLAAVVYTDPVRSWRGFFNQRRRWASKGRHYANLQLVVMIVLIYLFYALWLGLAIAAIFQPALRLWVGAALGIKIAAEFPLLWLAARHFKRVPLMLYFLPEQLLQIPYVVTIGLAGSLGRYTWKGRTITQ